MTTPITRREALAAVGVFAGGTVALGCPGPIARPMADPKIEQEYGNSFQSQANRPLVSVAGKNNMLAVYNVDANGVNTVRYIMIEVGTYLNDPAVCLSELHLESKLQQSIFPPPPWWRYTRGRWTHQRTGKTDIVASGTTALVICCNTRESLDDPSSPAYETEFTLVVGDAGVQHQSKLLVTALADKSVTAELIAPALKANPSDADLDAYAETLNFVCTDKAGKLTQPKKTSTYMVGGKKVLSIAVACILKHVKNARKADLHLGAADGSSPHS